MYQLALKKLIRLALAWWTRGDCPRFKLSFRGVKNVTTLSIVTVVQWLLTLSRSRPFGKKICRRAGAENRNDLRSYYFQSISYCTNGEDKNLPSLLAALK
jgi:hypothetical protein